MLGFSVEEGGKNGKEAVYGRTDHQQMKRSRGASGPGRKDGSRVKTDRSDGADVLPVAQRIQPATTAQFPGLSASGSQNEGVPSRWIHELPEPVSHVM